MQFDIEKTSFEELLTGLCERFRRDIRQGLCEVADEIKAAVGAQVEQQIHHDLSTVAGELKAEVRFETAALREQLVRAVGQVSAELKAEFRQVDVSTVMDELRQIRSRTEVDLSGLLDAIGKAEHEIEELKAQPAPPGARQWRPPGVASGESDFLLAVQEVRELRRAFPQVQVDLAGVLSIVRSIKADVDQSPVLRELAQLRQQGVQADLSPLLDELRDLRLQGPQAWVGKVDLSPVLAALEHVRAKLDLAPRGAAADAGPVLQELQAIKAQLQRPPRAEAELLAPVLAAVERLGARADPAPLLQELQALRQRPLQAQADLSLVTGALSELRKQVDLLASEKDLRQLRTQFEVDLLSLNKGLAELRQDSPRRGRHEPELLPTVAALREGVAELGGEVRQLGPQARAEHLEVLWALGEGRHRPQQQQQAEVDLSPALGALLEIRKQVALLPSDSELGQLRKLLEVNVSSLRQVDLTPVLQEIRDLRQQRPQTDLSPLLIELKGLWQHIPKGEAELSNLLKGLGEGLAELREQRGHPSQPEVLPAVQEVRESLAELRRELRAPRQASERQSLDTSLLLQELRDMKHQRPQVDPEFLSALTAVRDNVSDVWRVLREVQQLGATAKADRAETLKAVRESRPEQDLSAILQEVKELRQHQLLLRGDMALMPGFIKDCRSEAAAAAAAAAERRPSGSPSDAELQHALGTVRDGLAALRAEVQGVQQLGPQVERGLQDVMQAVRQPRPDSGITPVLVNVRDAMADVLRELRELGPLSKSGVAEILKALKDTNLLPAFGCVRDALAEIKEDLQRLASQAKAEPVVLERVIPDARPDSNLMPLLSTVQDSVAAVHKDLKQLGLPGKAEVAELLLLLRDIRPQLEGTAVLEELSDIKQHQVLAREGISLLRTEVRQVTSGLDFASVVKTIEESRTVVDLSPVLEAIHGIKAAVGFSQVLASVAESKSALLAALKQLQPKADVSLSTVLDAVRAVTFDVDLGPVLSEIRKIPPHIDGGLSTVLKATKDIRTDVDLAPVLREVRQVLAGSEHDLASVHKALRELRAEVDFAGLVREVRQLQHRAETDLSPVLKAIRESRVELDLTPVMTAIRQIAPQVSDIVRAVKPEVDLSPVFSSVRQVQAQLAPIFEQIQQVQSQVAVFVARVEDKLELQGKQLPEQLKVAHFIAELEEVSRLNKNLLALVDVNHQEVLAQFQTQRRMDPTASGSKPGFFYYPPAYNHEEATRGSGMWRLVSKDQAASGIVMNGNLGNSWMGPPPRDLADASLRAPLVGSLSQELGHVGAARAGEVHA